MPRGGGPAAAAASEADQAIRAGKSPCPLDENGVPPAGKGFGSGWPDRGRPDHPSAAQRPQRRTSPNSWLNKRLAGTKVLMVIAPEQFRDEELLVPKEKFEAAGAVVTVASTRTGEAKGMLGAKVNADKTLSEVKAQDFQAIVVVGGMGSPEFLWNEDKLHSLVQELNAAAK